MKNIVIKTFLAYALFIALQWFILSLVSPLGGSLIALFIDRDSSDSVETAITALDLYSDTTYYLFSFVAFYITTHVFFLRNINQASSSSGTNNP